MSKAAFKMPERRPAAQMDQWVAGAGEGAKPKAKPARLTIDLEPDLHARFKSTTALRGTNMVDEVRAFIEGYVSQSGG